jgi:endonuclease/exonuclease/phosphatase family metal-dependent hydrolase
VNAQRVTGEKGGGPGRDLVALDRLVASAGLGGYHRAVTHKPDGTGFIDHHNLVTCSRLPIADFRQLWHERVPAPAHDFLSARPPGGAPVRLTWDRPVLYTNIDTGHGRALHLFNVHLRAPLACPVPGQKAGAFAWNTAAGWAEGFYMSEIKRAAQALELRLEIDALFDAEPDAHICIAGDFNAEEHHAPLEILMADEDNTGNGALAARELVPVEHSLAEAMRFTVIHQGRRQMLDHILCSRPLLGHYRGAEIHNEALADEVTSSNAPSPSPVSSHAPVVALFDL